MATFIHDGSGIDYIPLADVSSGDVIVQGDLIGVSVRDIPANTLGALAVRGVFDFAKATGAGTAIAAGSTIYWEDALNEATTSDALGANKLLGKVAVAAGDNDPTVRVRMSQ